MIGGKKQFKRGQLLLALIGNKKCYCTAHSTVFVDNGRKRRVLVTHHDHHPTFGYGSQQYLDYNQVRPAIGGKNYGERYPRNGTHQKRQDRV